MSEFESGEMSLEAKFVEIEKLVMNNTEIESGEDWELLCEDFREQALAGYSVDEIAEMSEEEIQKAIYNCLYSQFVFGDTGEDPLGLLE